MQSEVTHIVHNAWTVNFNYTIDSFVNTDIAGVSHLAAFALNSSRSTTPCFMFLSSIGAVMDYKADTVPEASVADVTSVATQTGYAKSKFVAEHILNRAGERGLRISIVRCGQLSGNSVTGAWNLREYIPILLRSSVALGSIPEWFPVCSFHR
jgi:thioester reductase-like protein